MSSNREIFAGIDVSKPYLDLAFWNDNRSWRFDNDEPGIEALIDLLTESTVNLVVVEATGGFEKQAALAIAASPLPVAIVSPRRVKAFARANGRLAKTDRLDAHNPAPSPAASFSSSPAPFRACSKETTGKSHDHSREKPSPQRPSRGAGALDGAPKIAPGRSEAAR